MKEKYVMIVERGSERLNKVDESVNISSKKFELSGPFTEFDIKNRNQRFYNAANFIPVMNQMLERKRQLGVLYGEFDHPDVFDIAGKNASHVIQNLTHNESHNRVDGTIALLSTRWGKEARAIIDDGYPLFVSSRAAGVTDGQGHVQLKELFTYDIVLDPGFANARVCVNESYGYPKNDNVPYRIYEMNDSAVNSLFNDNKNDQKTSMDLKNMEQFLADEMAKIEFKIMSSLEGKTSPEEIKTLMEKYEAVNAELVKVHEYLSFLKTKVNYLVKENQKLVSDNSKLISEINENTAYSNHLATQIKKVGKYTNDIEKRLGVTEKFAEHVAEHVHANILFTESVAKETEIAQAFAEHIALETELTQKFVESVAKETEIAQKFAEHIAHESYKDEVFLNYISEKVDGIIDFNSQMLERVKKSTPLNESIGEEDDIHSMESPEEFLGIPAEQEVAANIEAGEGEGHEATEAPEGTEAGVPEVTGDLSGENTPPASIDQPGLPTDGSVPETPEATDIQPEGTPATVGSDLMGALVQILGSDATGVVCEVTPDGKLLIQKSGTEEMTEPMTMEQVKVIDTEESVLEAVTKTLAEIKKAKVVANTDPHFFCFLSEQQINDFKALDNSTRETVLLAMNESEYSSTQDVLAIIGRTVTNKNVSYEDKIVAAMPETLKEAWTAMAPELKNQVIVESKYFTLVTTADMQNFWNTRSFAKAVLNPEAHLVKESLNVETTDKFSDEFIDKFLKSMK